MKLLFLVLYLAFASSSSAVEQPEFFTPPQGAIRDAAFACALADLFLVNIYGNDEIREHRPLKAALANGIWEVRGTLPKKTVFGGVAIIKLRQKDGAVLGFTRTK